MIRDNMADNVNISSSVDTSAIDKLEQEMKSIDSIFQTTAKNIAAFNQISSASTKAITEIAEKSGVLASEFEKLKAAQVSLGQTTGFDNIKSAQEQFAKSSEQLTNAEEQKTKASEKTTVSLTTQSEALAKIAAQIQSVGTIALPIEKTSLPTGIPLTGGTGKGPPSFPPAPPGAAPDEPPPEDKAGKTLRARLARAEAIKDILERLGVDAEKLDSPSFERARSKINALAQTMGLTEGGIRRLEQAFEILDTRSLVPTTADVAKLVNRLQDLQRISQSVSDVQTAGAEKQAAALRKAAAEGEKLQETAKRREVAPGILGDALGGLGATPEVLSRLPADKADTVRRAVDQLNQALVSGKISVADLNNAFNRVVSGGFEPLEGAAKTAYTALNNVNKILKDEAATAERTTHVNEQIARTLATLNISDREIFRLDPSRANAARVAINNLASSLQSGKISSEDLNRAVQSLTSQSLIPLTGSAGVAAAQLGNLQSVVKGSSERISISLEGMIRLVETFVIKRTLSFLVKEFVEAFKESIKFEQELIKLSVSADLSVDKIGKLAENVTLLSTAFGQSRVDVASGAYQIYASHLTDAAGSTILLNDALKLSKATFSTTEEAAKSLTASIGIYGLSTEDAGRVSATLFGAVAAGRSELKDVDRVIGQTGVAATKLGLSLEETLAAFVNLREKGIPTDKAVQTLNTTFQRLIGSGTQTNEIFLKYGFQSTQAAVKTLGLAEALRLISEESKNGTGRVKELADTFLESDHNVKDITTSTENLRVTSERYDKAIKDVAGTVNERIKQVGQAFRNEFESIADSLKKGIVNFQDWLRTLSNTDEAVAAQDRVREKVDEVSKAHDKARQEAEDDSKRTERAYRGLFAVLNQQAISFLTNIRNQYQNHAAAVEEQFTSLRELTKRIVADSNREIKASQASIGKFFEETERKGFERRIAILPPQDQFRELQERLDTLRARGHQFFEEGQRQRGEEAFKEAEGIILKFMELNNKLSRDQVKIQNQLGDEFHRHLKAVDELGISALHLKGSEAEQAKQLQEITLHLEKQLKVLREHSFQYSDVSVRKNALNEISLRGLAVELAILQQGYQLKQRIAAQGAKDIPTELRKQEEATIGRIKKLEEDRNKLIDERARQGKLAPGIADQLNRLSEGVSDKLGFGGLFGKSFDQPVQNVLDKIKEAREAILNLGATPTTQAIEDVKAKINEAAKAFDELTPDEDQQGRLDALRQQLNNITDTIRSLSLQLKPGDEIQRQLDNINQQFDTLKQAAGGAASEIAKSFAGASNQADNLSGRMGDFIGNVNNAIQAVNGLVDRLGAAAGAAAGIQIPFAPAGGAALPGGAAGGIVRGPGGIDNVYARLTRGEFVVNRDSAERFYPVLNAINNMQGFAKGGMVSNTTTGNINVTINAANTEQGNLRNIGNALQREIRRGTIKF